MALIPQRIEEANLSIANVTCDASVFLGAVVRMNASGEAENALADSLANSNIIGIVTEKPSSTVCTIRVLGVTDSIFTGLDVTQEYYLSDTNAGELSTSIPTASGSVIIKVGQPYSNTEFLVLKGSRTVRL